MKKFLVLFLAPASIIEAWHKTPADKRRSAEAKMQREWQEWTGHNQKMFVDTGARAGGAKRVSAQGMRDTRSDVMRYATVQADTQEAAGQSFAGHPHLQFPKASIEIIDLAPPPGQ